MVKLLNWFLDDIKVWILTAVAAVILSAVTTAVLFGGSFTPLAWIAQVAFFALYMMLGGIAAKRIRDRFPDAKLPF